MSGEEKIIAGLRDALAGNVERLTVYVSLGRCRATFDGAGNAVLVECRYRRSGHPRWRSVPAGHRRERIIAEAKEKASRTTGKVI